jgi:hypothetical protein
MAAVPQILEMKLSCPSSTSENAPYPFAEFVLPARGRNGAQLPPSPIPPAERNPSGFPLVSNSVCPGFFHDCARLVTDGRGP